MLGGLSPATLVMTCSAALVLATESPVLSCPRYARKDQCDEDSHNIFRFKDPTVQFFYEVEDFIELQCVYQYFVDYLESASRFLPRFQPALRVHNVTMTNCLPTDYASLFVTLNVTLLTPFNLELYKTEDPLTAAHFAGLPPVHHLTLRHVYYDLHGHILPASLEGLTVDTLLLDDTLLQDLPLTLTELRLLTLVLFSVPAAVLNLPELRTLYMESYSHQRTVTLERGNASKLRHLHVVGADGALLSRWAPPVLEEVILEDWEAGHTQPVPACDKLVKLTLFRPKVFAFPNGWVARCPHLKELYIEDIVMWELPDLAGILENAAHLTNFTIRGARLASLSEQLFANTPNLTYLDLSYNNLTQLPPQIFANTPNLTHLDLSDNNLVQLPPQIFANTPNLTHLDLSDNKLIQLPPQLFSNTPNLTQFDLSDNQLTQLPPQLFANTPNFSHLNVSYNNLTQLPPQLFANTPNFSHLNVSYNNLTQLPPQLFANTPNLTYLNVSYNNLTQLPPQLFVNTPNLTHLDLSLNQLTQLPSSMMKLPLSSLDLGDNLLNASEIAELATITDLRKLSLRGNKGLGDLCSVNDSNGPANTTQGGLSPALVMCCAELLRTTAKTPVLRCPNGIWDSRRDECEEDNHNRFRMNNDTIVNFFYEVEHFITLECDRFPYGRPEGKLDLERVSRFLPRFQPALRVRNVTVKNCLPTNYTLLFVTLNVTLISPFNLDVENTGQDESLTAAHFAHLPPLHHLTLQKADCNLHGLLPASLESLTVKDMSLLNNTMLEALPLTLTKLQLVKVFIDRLPAAVMNLPELRSLYVDPVNGNVMVEPGKASQLRQLHVVGADGALLSEWAPPVLEEVTLDHWRAWRLEPVPACDKLVNLTLVFTSVHSVPTGWVAHCLHLKKFHIGVLSIKLPELAGMLENATHLTSFSIQGDSLSSLPEELFADTPQLLKLDLRYHYFSELPVQLFANNHHLNHLILRSNQIKQLHPQIFANNLNLTHLDLSDNQLMQLPSSMMKLRLLSLDLDHNLLNASVVAELAAITDLKSLSLKGNKRLGDLCSVNDSVVPVHRDTSSLASLSNLESLVMEATNISVICSDWLEGMVNLTYLDLRSTWIVNLTYEDLQYRRSVPAEVKLDGIIYFTADDYDKAAETAAATKPSRYVTVTTYSPFLPTCNLYWVTKALNKGFLPLHDVLIEDELRLTSFHAENLLCNRTDLCNTVPVNCTCGMAGGGLLRVICVNIGLSNVPRLPVSASNHTVDLVLSSNLIIELSPKDLPSYLRVIDLRNNSLSYIDEATARALVSGVNRRVLLADNPLECSCSAAPALRVLREYAAVLVGYDALRCEDGGTLMDAINDDCMTSSSTPGVPTASMSPVTWTVTLIASLVSVGVTALAVGLWWKWHRNVLGHSRALLWELGWRSREERDAAWPLDAFVVFGRGDESPALEVTARLERGPRARRVCLAERDWVPPARLSECIAVSAGWARRTVVLVSREWERSLEDDEIRAAYAPSVGRGALVLVLPSAGELEDAALRRYATDYPHLVLCRDAPNFLRRLEHIVPPTPKSPPPSEYIQLVPLNLDR